VVPAFPPVNGGAIGQARTDPEGTYEDPDNKCEDGNELHALGFAVRTPRPSLPTESPHQSHHSRLEAACSHVLLGVLRVLMGALLEDGTPTFLRLLALL
jgi:hypothetical protein